MDFTAFIANYLDETGTISKSVDPQQISRVAEILVKVKQSQGRVFFLGVGGGAGSGSHAANDFSKYAGISSFCLGDNASLLTALANDEGWDLIFKRQLEMHRLSPNDCIFIFSVNGGTETISKNLVVAVQYAKEIGCKIVGVVGREDGITAREADVCVIIPCPNPEMRTPHTEDFQLIMNHLLCNILHQYEASAVS